ncbi:hypothetical protein [Streptomyces melanogenes]|uniref:hypothetical protein n=1 Tax=Streptomyces melanogenes TaxID=67326 RepID=UPI00167E81F0|nr:hypothetical protein [Streptomyces melanogenes]GGP81921.1 hypothetical protein GCM10010278_70740 [Streptomyces melanogenes]
MRAARAQRPVRLVQDPGLRRGLGLDEDHMRLSTKAVGEWVPPSACVSAMWAARPRTDDPGEK